MEEIKPLVDVITQAGPLGLFVVMTYVWWLERGERIKSQERERVLIRDFLKSTIKQTNAIRSLRYVFLHGRAPAPDEYEAEDVD